MRVKIESRYFGEDDGEWGDMPPAIFMAGLETLFGVDREDPFYPASIEIEFADGVVGRYRECE